MVQFNGQCGCPYCTSSTLNVRIDKCGNCRVYPYMRKADHVTDIQERTHEQTFQDASLAREQKIAGHKNDTVNGIKGLSPSFGPLGYDVLREQV